jgi:serine/threonine-protein kinase
MATVAARPSAAAGDQAPVSGEDRTDPGDLRTLGAYQTIAEAGPEDLDELLSEIRKPLIGRLDFEDLIGKGGMGNVELVLDRALRRRLAKKIIHPDLSDEQQALYLFVREARITSQLDHPNIVPVHHLGEDEDGKLFFTMKHVKGRPLTAMIQALPKGSLRRIDLVAVLDVLLKVCDALSFAHSRGVLHCDIKPDNIMVGDFGEVYLMDWGISKVLGVSEPNVKRLEGIDETSVGLTSGLAMGTPAYMSPEQATGNRDGLDERSDVFSMGAILYRILAGKAPYGAESTTSLLSKARAARIEVPVVARGSGVPLELQRVAMRALAPRREDRFRTIRHFRDELQTYLFGGGDFPMARFKRGEHIIHQGDRGQAVYIIEKGSCRAYRKEGGETIELATLGPGEVFGETAILADVPRTASVVALQDMQVYVVTRQVMETELADIKPWLARLVRALAERFEDERTRKRGTGRVPDKG